jgi:hypothetical protein
LLGAGYLAGLLVALKFNKKSPTSLEKDMAGDDKLNAIGKNLLDIHKNIFESAQDAVFSPENKKIIADYKEQFLTELEAFKKEAGAELTKLTDKGSATKEEMEARIQEIYESRLELLEKAKKKGVALMTDAKDEGMDLVEEGKKVSNRVYDQAKKQLEAIYADMKKSIPKK